MSQHKMKSGDSRRRDSKKGAAFTAPGNCPCLERIKMRVVFKKQDASGGMGVMCVDENGNERDCPSGLVPLFSVEGVAATAPSHCPCLERIKMRVVLKPQDASGDMGVMCVDESGNERDCPTGLVPVVVQEGATAMAGSMWCPCVPSAWGLEPEDLAGVRGLGSRPVPFFSAL